MHPSDIELHWHYNREFDEGLLQRIPEISYEDDTKDIPAAPDVSNYLVSEVSSTNFGFHLMVMNLRWCWYTKLLHLVHVLNYVIGTSGFLFMSG